MLLILALLSYLDYQDFRDYQDYRGLFRCHRHHLKTILLHHQIYDGRQTGVLAFKFPQLVHCEGLKAQLWKKCQQEDD